MNSIFGIPIITSEHVPVDITTKLVIERPFWRRVIAGRLHDYRDVESHRIWFIKGAALAHPEVIAEIRDISI